MEIKIVKPIEIAKEKWSKDRGFVITALSTLLVAIGLLQALHFFGSFEPKVIFGPFYILPIPVNVDFKKSDFEPTPAFVLPLGFFNDGDKVGLIKKISVSLTYVTTSPFVLKPLIFKAFQEVDTVKFSEVRCLKTGVDNVPYVPFSLGENESKQKSIVIMPPRGVVVRLLAGTYDLQLLVEADDKTIAMARRKILISDSKKQAFVERKLLFFADGEETPVLIFPSVGCEEAGK